MGSSKRCAGTAGRKIALRLARYQQKELMQYMAAEYDWQRMMFIDHPGDQEFESQAYQDRFYPETVHAVAAGNLEKGNGIHGRSLPSPRCGWIDYCCLLP